MRIKNVMTMDELEARQKKIQRAIVVLNVLLVIYILGVCIYEFVFNN